MRRARGAAAIEFALTLPIMIWVFLGIVELSFLQSRMFVVSRAARDACRVGSGVLEGVNPNGDQIEAAARTHAQFVLDSAQMDCGTGCTILADWHDDDGMMMLNVRVAVPYQAFTGVLPMIPDHVVAEFNMLTQQQSWN